MLSVSVIRGGSKATMPYDYNSSRQSREVVLSSTRSEYYLYDGLNRLKSYDRGTLTSGTITNRTRNEAWGLSPVILTEMM